jgi:hypothetical protein
MSCDVTELLLNREYVHSWRLPVLLGCRCLRKLAPKAVERLADDWERLVSAPRSVEVEWKEIPIAYAGR